IRDFHVTGVQTCALPISNWSKASFDSINLNLLKTKITTSYYVNTFKSNVRDFERKYIEEFRIKPSEYAYKGFDTGYFFGSLLGRSEERRVGKECRSRWWR